MAMLTIAVLAIGNFSGRAATTQVWVEPADTFPLQAHPLPEPLDRWQDPNSSGDYFAEVQTTPSGYLVWSEFPVKIYIEVPHLSTDRLRQWMSAVSDAVAAWNVYIPLTQIEGSENADITIAQRRPPPERFPNGTFRARSALTRYEFYVRGDPQGNRKMLCHRFEIAISPTQTGNYVRAAVLHELGHALGIWGHSPVETDTLYFSQVRQPQSISPRDVNTLKRVYEQPTRLGWWIASDS